MSKEPLKYLLIDPVARTITEATEPLPLDRLQELVGGYIEAVTREYGGESHTLFINEEGRLLNLPRFILRSDNFEEDLCGRAVVVGPPDSEGETTSTLLKAKDIEPFISWIAINQQPENPVTELRVRVYTDPSRFRVCVWNPAVYKWEPTVDYTQAAASGYVKIHEVLGEELGLLPATMRQLYLPGKILTNYEFALARRFIEQAITYVAEKHKLQLKEEDGIETI